MWASVVAVHQLSCSMACGIFPSQGSKLWLLKWQAHSLPSHQGSPLLFFVMDFLMFLLMYSE